ARRRRAPRPRRWRRRRRPLRRSAWRRARRTSGSGTGPRRRLDMLAEGAQCSPRPTARRGCPSVASEPREVESMITMMMVVGGAALLLGIARTVVFVSAVSGRAETASSRRMEGMLLIMVLMVFGLLVFGLGLLWAIAGVGS